MSQDGRVASGGLSRRNLLKAGAASLATVLGGPQAGIGTAVGAAPVGSERDLVLVNGKIHTMDARDRIAASITIRGGRIIALEYGGHGNQGSHGDQRVIDLKGRTVVPGIIDNHNHIVLMGNRPGHHTPLENAYSIAEVKDTLAARAAGVPKGEFISTIGGFHPNQFA
jgi:predicted amidohydrolase YtcJ